MQTKKIFLIVLCSMLSIFNIATHGLGLRTAFAANGATQKEIESFKTEFSYEMAQLTAAVIALPNTNPDKFKTDVNFFTTKTVAGLNSKIPEAQRTEFMNEMAQIAKKIVNNPKLDVAKAKADFSYDISQLTAKITNKVEQDARSGQPIVFSPNPSGGTNLAGNSTAQNFSQQPSQDSAQKAKAVTPESEAKPVGKNEIKEQQTGYGATAKTTAKPLATPTPVTPDMYNRLMDDLMNTGERKKPLDNKVKIDGNIRYHYANNTGSPIWGKSTSGLRARIGIETVLNKDWRLNGMIEAKKSFLNYDDTVTFRLSAGGRIGSSFLRVGSFGYFMAEGNIYDSTFVGGRLDINTSPIKYTLSFGNTDYTQNMIIATARYNDLDYNVEAGVYNYQPNDTTQSNNTIATLSGNYRFSNFTLGSMLLWASQKDAKGNNLGYVQSLYFGDLKEYRPGTYNVFVKYYNQPRYTYIAPTMNGRGGWMQGFKGWGFGLNYALMKNLVGSMEYYVLSDLVTGDPGNTWWTSLTYYF